MIYGVGSLLSKAVGFLLIPFYTHYLRPSQYGTLELLDLTMGFVGLLLSVWVTTPLVRFYHDTEDEAERRIVVSTTMWTVGCVAMALSSTALLCSTEISTLVLKSPNFSFCVKIVAVSFFLSSINVVAWNYFRAKERSALIVSFNLCSLVIMLTINIYFVGVLKLGVLGVLYGGLLGNYVVNAILTVKMLREVGLGFDFQKMKALAVFGARLVFTNIGAFILNFSDRFFLQSYSNSSSVGTYALGYKFGYMLSFLVIQPFNMIWSARMYEIAKKQDAKRIFAQFGAYLCLVLTSVALGISVVMKDVISIMTAADFHSAYRIVPLIALAYVFQGLTYHFQTGILIEKKTFYMGIMGGMAALTNVALNFLLIPLYKGMGAAWATTVSFLGLALLAYSFSQRTYPVPYKILKFCGPILLATGMYLISTMITITIPALSIAVKLLLVPAFWAILYLLGYFDKEEVVKVKSLFRMILLRYVWRTAILPGG